MAGSLLVAVGGRRRVAVLTAFALLVAGSLFLSQHIVTHAATISVTTTTDELNNDGDCSLREAIQAANTDAAVDACTAGSGTDTVTLPAGTYTLSIAGTGEDANATGDLDVTSNLTINGAGTAGAIVDGAGLDRVLHITGGSVEISGLTLRNGSENLGGGIRNGGTLTLTGSTVSGNNGGGIFNGGTLTVTNSTISGNAGGTGGGIHNGGTLTVTNSTISGNSAGFGGGIWNEGILTLTSSTVSGNTAEFDLSGIYNGTLKNTIVANNTGGLGSECSGITSAGHNLSSGSSCGFTAVGDLQNTNPMLGPLQNNGGPTQTHALLVGSPAIDAGSPDCPPPAADQRGVARPQRIFCDIGAFEFEPGVGGIAELPEVAGTPVEAEDGKAWGPGALASLAAAVAGGSVGLGAIAWYGKRRFSR